MKALPKGDKLIGGTQTADIVQDAICKLYTGERTWDPKTNPDLLKFLTKSIIPSLVYNYYNDSLVKTEIRSSDLNPSLSEEKEDTGDFWENTKGKGPLPDEEIYAKEIINTIRKNLEEDNDDDGLIIFEEIIKGNKPLEIKEDLGIPIKDIYNAIKRIRNTKANQFKPTFNNKK
jgi:hypothetical protein